MSSNDADTNSTFLYFAYASNLFSGRVQEKDRTATRKSIGILHGYQLEFVHWSEKWGGAMANILREPASTVYGVVWELPLKDMDSLDKQEAVLEGIYERIEIQVESNGQPLLCWVYKLTPEWRDRTLEKYGGKENLKPSAEYKAVILRGAVESQLPQEYIQFLKGIESHD